MNRSHRRQKCVSNLILISWSLFFPFSPVLHLAELICQPGASDCLPGTRLSLQNVKHNESKKTHNESGHGDPRAPGSASARLSSKATQTGRALSPTPPRDAGDPSRQLGHAADRDASAGHRHSHTASSTSLAHSALGKGRAQTASPAAQGHVFLAWALHTSHGNKGRKNQSLWKF